MDNQSSNEIKYGKQTIKSDALLQFVTSKKYGFARHAIVIITIIIFLWNSKIPGEFQGVYDTLDWMLMACTILAILYTNIYILVPKILYHGKLLYYFLALIGFTAICTSIYYSCFHFILVKHILSPSMSLTVIQVKTIILFGLLLTLAMASTAFKFFQQWIADAGRMHELEKRAMASELQALRSQIQPHFLFNMLNSIKVLISREPEKATHITMKLSDFLRHLLYTTHEKDVYANSEIRFLDDYLSLEKMRRDDFEYTLDYNEEQLKGVKIPPNIFLILVENAVKHSADPIDDSYIDIKIEVKNNFMYFQSTNSVPNIMGAHTKDGGLGLVNIERRLTLLYGQDYYLNSSHNSQEYIACLKLPI